MLTHINPKLPMRNRAVTRDFYTRQLGFEQFGGDYEDYLMVEKDHIQIHFFLFKDLDPKENYGQVYIRVTEIEALYQSYSEEKGVIHLNAPLKKTAWGQKEFSILDPDTNLLTFGETI